MMEMNQEDGDHGDQWHLGAFSCSSCGLSNSDEKNLSDWSKQLLVNGMKTPVGQPKVPYTSMSPQQLSPSNRNKITYSKKAKASPKTPEELQSSGAGVLKYKGDNSQLQYNLFAEFATHDKHDR